MINANKISLFQGREFINNLVIHAAGSIGMPSLSYLSGKNIFHDDRQAAIMAATGLTLGYLRSRKNTAKAIKTQLAGRQLPKDHIISQTVLKLAEKAGLENTPEIYVMPPNGKVKQGMAYAGAAGTPKESVIIVSSNFDKMLSLREMRGVMAHEISHIENYDTQMDAFHRGSKFMANIGIPIAFLTTVAAITPWVSLPTMGFIGTALGLSAGGNILKAQISQAMERKADRGAIRLTMNPWALASGLNRIIEINRPGVKQDLNPNDGLTARFLKKLFGSHPVPESRMKRFRAMAANITARFPDQAKRLKQTTLQEIKDFEINSNRRRPEHQILIAEQILQQIATRMRNNTRRITSHFNVSAPHILTHALRLEEKFENAIERTKIVPEKPLDVALEIS